MTLVETKWRDQWIAENYPNSMWFIDTNGEVVVCLGEDENGNACF